MAEALAVNIEEVIDDDVAIQAALDRAFRTAVLEHRQLGRRRVQERRRHLLVLLGQRDPELDPREPPAALAQLRFYPREDFNADNSANAAAVACEQFARADLIQIVAVTHFSSLTDFLVSAVAGATRLSRSQRVRSH